MTENPKNLKKWANDIKETYKIFGQNKLEPTKSEIKMRILARRSIVALKDIKNTSVKIALESVEKLLKNSLDKSKLDKIYASSIEETKLALKKKSS